MTKRKAGLHKEISSIFDGVPIPKSNGGHEERSEPDKWRLETPAPAKAPAPAPKTAPTPKPKHPAQLQPKAAPTEQSKAAPTEQSKAAKADRTKKSTKQNALQKTWQQIRQQIQSKLFSSKSGVSSARQKTIAILIPVLSIVLIFVLVQAFGTSPRKIKAITKKSTTNTAGANSKIVWQIPDPYPTTLRDPMQFGSTATTQAEPGKLIVRSIVYSENRSTRSVGIGNQIVHEGETVLGATVVKINKDSVEFEMNGKKWAQKVQR